MKTQLRFSIVTTFFVISFLFVSLLFAQIGSDIGSDPTKGKTKGDGISDHVSGEWPDGTTWTPDDLTSGTAILILYDTREDNAFE